MNMVKFMIIAIGLAISAFHIHPAAAQGVNSGCILVENMSNENHSVANYSNRCNVCVGFLPVIVGRFVDPNGHLITALAGQDRNTAIRIPQNGTIVKLLPNQHQMEYFPWYEGEGTYMAQSVRAC